MKISIIIPTYNSERVIEECLEGIISSDFTDYELIIIDNLSTDSTLDIVKKYTKKVITLQKDMERNYARNEGLNHARGEIIVFIDSDNVIYPNSLQIVANYFDQNPKISAVTGIVSIEHPNNNFFSQYKNLYMNYILGQMPLTVTFLQGDIYAVRSCDTKDVVIDTITDDTARGQQLHQENKIIHHLKNLEVIHLKKYNFFSLCKNDFIVPFEWTKVFLKNKGWKQLFRNGVGFAHSPKEQLISIMLISLILFLASANTQLNLSIAIFVAMILLWVFLNIKFFTFLIKVRGITFGVIKSIPFTFIDHIIMAAGIAIGLLDYFISLKGKK